MKAIAIIEIPDDGFEKGKWYIDGYIRYTEDESTMKRFDKDMIPLKPLPNRWIPQLNGLSIEQQIRNIDFAAGWNACLEKTLGENK